MSKGTVKADVAGIFDTELGDYREFNIGEGVPEEIVKELNNAVNNASYVQDLTEQVRSFERR